MYKIEYITNQFKKTFGKKYENYCITRIYNLVNRDDLKIVTQQLFRRDKNKIALADLYLPQINMWIEIDEGHHINNKNADNKRTEEVLKNSIMSKEIKQKYDALEEVIYIKKEEPFRINVCNKTLSEINEQIDKIVVEINKRIKETGNKYIPWTGLNTNPEEYIKKGIIKVSDNAKFKYIKTIGLLFNKDKVPIRHGYIKIKKGVYYWCPILKINGNECDNNAWENEINDDGTIIYENQKNRDDNYLSSVIDENPIRYIFAKYKDETGNRIYKFIGVFTLDIEKSKKANKRIWKKVSDEINLREFFLK